MIGFIAALMVMGADAGTPSINTYRELQFVAIVKSIEKDLPPTFECKALFNDKNPDVALLSCRTESGNAFSSLSIWRDSQWVAMNGVFTTK